MCVLKESVFSADDQKLFFIPRHRYISGPRPFFVVAHAGGMGANCITVPGLLLRLYSADLVIVFSLSLAHFHLAFFAPQIILPRDALISPLCLPPKK